MMAGHRVLAQEARELGRDPLRHLARVDEHDGGAMGADELRHPLVDLLPLLVRAHGGERRGRDLDPEVELAEGARVHHRAVPSRPGQEARHLLEGPLGGGEADALEGTPGQRLQPLQGQREVRAPLVAHDGVDLVHDGGADGGEHAPPALAREEDVERLRRGHQDVGRAPGHGRALRARSVTGADEHAHLGQRRIERAQSFERTREVLLHVVRERAQRRDVEDLRRVRERGPLPDQGVDRGEKRRERLPRAGGRRDERIVAAPNRAPAFKLRVCGFGAFYSKSAGPPLAEDRMKILG